jgi:mxaJ protein
MSSVFKSLLIFIGVVASYGAELRVCADPNNMPYSNAQGRGFENELAQMIARDFGRTLVYHWAPQRGRYLKNGLNAGRCDVVLGAVSGMDRVWTTRPYYRSSYVFVARSDGGASIRSFDDPALQRARIGVHVLQSEDATSPPAQVLLDRGLTRNLHWYKLYPDFTRENPQAALIEAVASGDVDVALVWGPLAGYFAKHATAPLSVTPVPNQVEKSIPLAFDISMAVRRGDTGLLSALNKELKFRKSEIRELLHKYGVPTVTGMEAQSSFARR